MTSMTETSKAYADALFSLAMEQGEDEATLDALADSVNTQRLSNHPMPLTRDELKSIYRRAFTRRAGADRQVCIDLWQYYGK